MGFSRSSCRTIYHFVGTRRVLLLQYLSLRSVRPVCRNWLSRYQVFSRRVGPVAHPPNYCQNNVFVRRVMGKWPTDLQFHIAASASGCIRVDVWPHAQQLSPQQRITKSLLAQQWFLVRAGETSAALLALPRRLFCYI